jgi:hypothetical protein
MPGLPGIFITPHGSQDAKNAADARQREANIAAAKVVMPAIEAQVTKVGDPFQKQAIRLLAAEAYSGSLAPAEIDKRFGAITKELRDDARSRENAAKQAAAARQRQDEKPPSEGQGNAMSRLTVMLPEARRIETLPPLSEAGRQILFEELALKNAAEKSPTADALARLAGFRKSVQGRLQGTDKRVYAAYMAFADPLVRQRTGASAKADEVGMLLDPIMPAPGDGEIEIADKRTRRRDYLRSFAIQTKNPEEWYPQIDKVYDETGSGAHASPPAPPAPSGDVIKDSNARADAILQTKKRRNKK